MRARRTPPIPMPVVSPSVNARDGSWQEAQERSPAPERRGSRKRSSPSAIRSASVGVGAATAGREKIDEYLAEPSCLERAGAYAYRLDGDPYIDRVEGSETNIVGLPMELVVRLVGPPPPRPGNRSEG